MPQVWQAVHSLHPTCRTLEAANPVADAHHPLVGAATVTQAHDSFANQQELPVPFTLRVRPYRSTRQRMLADAINAAADSIRAAHGETCECAC